MKGTVISWGIAKKARGVLIREADNLVIPLDINAGKHELLSWLQTGFTGFDKESPSCAVLGEIEVPNDLVDRSLKLLEALDNFYDSLGPFKQRILSEDILMDQKKKLSLKTY